MSSEGLGDMFESDFFASADFNPSIISLRWNVSEVNTSIIFPAKYCWCYLLGSATPARFFVLVETDICLSAVSLARKTCSPLITLTISLTSFHCLVTVY
jgi:hypothetical protein